MFIRDCEVCKKYYFREGILATRPDGKKLERDKNSPPNCKICKKYDSESKIVWQKFTRKNRYFFNAFLVARHFHVLPRPGGSDQQDPKTLQILVLLNEMFERFKKISNEEFQVQLFGILGKQ